MIYHVCPSPKMYIRLQIKKVIPIFCIFLISFSARALYCIDENRVYSRDSIEYIKYSKELIIRKVNYIPSFELNKGVYYPPIYFFLIKTFSPTPSDCAFVGSLISFLAGVFFCLIMYYIGLVLFKNRFDAFLTGFFPSVTPYLIELSFQVQREMLSLLFLSIMSFYLIKDQPGLCDYLLSGLFCGLSILTRYESVEYLLLFLGVILIRAMCQKIKPQKIFSGFIVFYISLFATVLFCSLTLQIPFSLYVEQFNKISSLF